MEITFFRSSSLNQWSYCQMSYYINYVLGKSQATNIKTEKGTVVHKVLEVLAGLKMNLDNTGKCFYEDENLGMIKCSKKDFMAESTLTDEEVDKINKSMINKDTYKDQPRLSYGHKRYGVKVVNNILKQAYDYYASKSDHEWGNIEWRDCFNFTWIPLDLDDGEFDPRKRTIVCPEKAFNFIIEEDWAKLADGSYLGIKGTIDLTTKIDDDTIEIIDWKGLPVETPIPTVNGWSTMGDLEVGDLVFDKDGKITKVVAKSEKTVKPCYKITFDDKTIAICDNEHLWTLENETVVDILNLKVGDKISVAKPLSLRNKTLPIDPYVLGLWLGDGRNRNGEISKNDEFVFQEVERRGYKLGDDIGGKDRCVTRTVLGLVTELKKLNLTHNKHIPQAYLRASFRQRLDLLRGLMDSDGNANPTRKQAVFTSCNKKLSDDVKELLLTLGQRPNQGTTKQSGFGLTVAAYPIHFRPININPFLLPRKADRIDPTWGSGISHRRLIKNIELIEEKETQCIMVDSPTSTYLCTENMIPTHNTGQRLDWATGEKKDYDQLCKDKQLMLYYYAAKRAFPEFKNVIISIFFIRDGGPFTLCFDDTTEIKIKSILAHTRGQIESATLPKMLDESHKDFRCKLLCSYFKNKVGKVSYCDYISNSIKLHGIDATTLKERQEGFKISHYQNPGE